MRAFLLWSCLFTSLAAFAEDAPVAKPRDKVRVVLDDMGEVGLRITDAQNLASDLLLALREHVGEGAVIYDGRAAALRNLKRLSGGLHESQAADLAFYVEAAKTADVRVRARFRVRADQHEVVLTCRRGGQKPDQIVAEKVLRGATFAEVREAAEASVISFCPLLEDLKPRNEAPRATTPAGQTVPKPYKPKPFSPPPLRN